MKKLLFVYNAKSDYWSKKIDFAHKIISPSTYNCDLCALTHGNFGETEIWKEFRENSKSTLEFTYKDEFQKLYPKIEASFPVVFQNKNNNLSILINATALSKIKNIEELIALIKETL